MFNLVPDSALLSRVISQATAPAFLLGAVAGFVSILSVRMSSVIERIRSLNDIADNDSSRARLKSDIPRLKHRVDILTSATRMTVASGICASLLIIVAFVFAFLGLQYVYGSAILFLSALVLLGAALLRLSQELGMTLSEADHYR
jgi:VIT1/CCC1 family predicted Fe2+/Mn2+ transporter